MKHSKLAAPAKRFPSLLGILMIIASCGETSECKNNGLDYKSTTNEIVCQNSPQELGQDGTAVLTFYCYWNWEAVSNGSIGNSYERGAEVTFTATGGTCTSSAISDEKGVVTCVFTATDPANFKGGTVTASLRVFSRSMDGRYDDMNTYRTAVGEILPPSRPIKGKAKPKIRVIGEEKPVVGEDGKSKIIFEVSERIEGETADRLVGGAEVKFDNSRPDQATLSQEKATTDEKGQVSVELQVKDADNFEGADVTAKAEVKYADGSTEVETKVSVQPSNTSRYTLTCVNSPQTVDATTKQATLWFKLMEKTGTETKPVENATLDFTTNEGEVWASSMTMWTNDEGQMAATFKTDDILNFVEATITATFEKDGKTCSAQGVVKGLEWTYSLACTNSGQAIDETGKATLSFELKADAKDANGKEISLGVPSASVAFTATGGSVSPASGTTDAAGKVNAVFQASEPDTFEEGTVTGSYTKGDKSATGVGTVVGMPKDEPQDEGLKKAHKLDDNEYVVEDTKVKVEDLPEGEGMRDYILYGEKKDYDGTPMVFFLEFCKEHPEHATVGGGAIHIRPDQLGKEVDMLKEEPNRMAWMNLFSNKDVNKPYNPETNPSTNFSAGSTEGNAQLEKATCKISQNSDGSYTALAYFKTKDGKEGYFKMKATRKANW
ncbi:MAG: Ig-like domain-containing protein [Bacteroidales bacterium]|nr:Ig-like domain-containing protein [Bacteroidales bacterium]